MNQLVLWAPLIGDNPASSVRSRPNLRHPGYPWLAYFLKYPRSRYTEYNFVGNMKTYIKYNHINKIHDCIILYVRNLGNSRFTKGTSANLERSHRLPHDCTKVMHCKIWGYHLKKDYSKYLHRYGIPFQRRYRSCLSNCSKPIPISYPW